MRISVLLAICFIFGLSSYAAAQGPRDCGFGFDIDTQSSAFQSMVVDGEQKRGFWLSINRAPADVRSFARHIGRLQVCLMTPDGKPRSIQRGGRTIELKSPFLANCTAALLPNNRLLTNAHCFYNPELERAGFSIVREARIDFNYTSKDDTGAVRTYLVSPRELNVDKDLDALVLQVLGGDANAELGGHIPMKMMSQVEPFQALGMIHHPGADPQQYSSGTCQVHRRQTEIPDNRSPFRHTCESMGGSSGSLLFDSRTLAVVALHNQGGLNPTGDSFNGGHKIEKIEASLNLGFEEATLQREASQSALQALTDAFLIADPAERLSALRAVLLKFPNSTSAEKAQTAIAQLEARFDSAGSATAAEEALTAALLQKDPKEKEQALRDVTLNHPNQPAARQAAIVLSSLASDTETLPKPKPDVSPKQVPSGKALLAPITRSQLDIMAAQAGENSTQATVLDRGHLRCGVSSGLRGFSQPDNNGRWQGFDVDFCRSVAAAVLDDPEAVEFVPTSARTRFTALKSGDVDLLARNTTWTYSRDVDLKFDYPGVSFFDGQGFLLRRSLGVTAATELSGATVCVARGTTTELHLADYFRANNMQYELVAVSSFSESLSAYLSHHCDVFTADRSALAAMRAGFDDPSEHIILNEVISREPLGPVVRHGDQNWGHIVGSVLNALKLAETMEIRQDQVSDIVRVAALGRLESHLETSILGGRFLNLSDDMMLRVVKAVGNYGELYDRHFGVDSPLNLPRGLQAIWNNGGLHYSEFGPSFSAMATSQWPENGEVSLKKIKERGQLRCGVDELSPPFSQSDPAIPGAHGFGSELCRAISAAIFGSPDFYTHVFADSEVLPALLAAGDVDIIPTPVKIFEELDHPQFVKSVPWFFSSTGIVVLDSLDVQKHEDLSRTIVCTIPNVPHHSIMASRINVLGNPTVDVFDEESGFHGFAHSRRCDAFINNTAKLAIAIQQDRSTIEKSRILDGPGPLRPIRPILHTSDNRLVDLVNWVIYSLITAEELGVTRSNVFSLASGTSNPEINRLLGSEGNFGEMLGLSHDWAVQVIAAVGNYGEIYDLYFGSRTGLNWERGLNKLWSDGGLHISPPFR